MDVNSYREFLLRNLPDAKLASGRTEVVCKCFYCSDNGDHHHMYVSIPRPGEPSKYNCFKCGAGGWVTAKKLHEWNIFDQDMEIELTLYYKGIKSGIALSKHDGIAMLNNTFISDNEMSALKLKYINNRLGLNLTYKDMLDNKIVLNIYDLLNSNYINEVTRDPRVVDSLNNYFLGFISFDNNYINFKRLIPEGKLHESVDIRYINYKIFNNEQDNSKKFYLIPTKINMYDTNPIKVHIAEGPFDALSIKYNLRKEFYNNIYTAVAGKAYKGVLRQIVNFIKLVNLEIHLYPDSDIDNDVIDDFKDYARLYGYNVFIHRNLIGKDMGESIDKIKEYIE